MPAPQKGSVTNLAKNEELGSWANAANKSNTSARSSANKRRGTAKKKKSEKQKERERARAAGRGKTRSNQP
jgi:hypothetical protein